MINSASNKPQRKHLDQFQKPSPPRTKKQVQQFLGLTNWVREYIKDYAFIAAQITNLLITKKNFQTDY